MIFRAQHQVVSTHCFYVSCLLCVRIYEHHMILEPAFATLTLWCGICCVSSVAITTNINRDYWFLISPNNYNMVAPE